VQIRVPTVPYHSNVKWSKLSYLGGSHEFILRSQNLWDFVLQI